MKTTKGLLIKGPWDEARLSSDELEDKGKTRSMVGGEKPLLEPLSTFSTSVVPIASEGSWNQAKINNIKVCSQTIIMPHLTPPLIEPSIDFLYSNSTRASMYRLLNNIKVPKKRNFISLIISIIKGLFR